MQKCPYLIYISGQFYSNTKKSNFKKNKILLKILFIYNWWKFDLNKKNGIKKIIILIYKLISNLVQRMRTKKRHASNQIDSGLKFDCSFSHESIKCSFNTENEFILAIPNLSKGIRQNFEWNLWNKINVGSAYA